jgi:hypothetical protein
MVKMFFVEKEQNIPGKTGFSYEVFHVFRIYYLPDLNEKLNFLHPD